jgi:hypothetical protein
MGFINELATVSWPKPRVNKFQGKIAQFFQVLLELSVVFYAVLVLHDFFGYIDAYPYLALDDSLANLSYALATEGRYGFLSSPLQGPANVPRHDGFFNYGPWYFYLGAVLIWLFGYSITLLRSVHLLVILLTVVAAYLWFRRGEGKVAAALFALAVLFCFDTAQWPMVRPDIIVSLFALLLVICSGLAIKTQKPIYWFLAGLSATCGAFSHLIAISLILACATIFLVAQLFHWRTNPSPNLAGYRRFGWPFLAVFSGGVAGVFMFYASCGFRLQDHWHLLTAYQALTTANSKNLLGTASYGSILLKHIHLAFDYLPSNLQVGLWFMLLIGLAIVILSTRFWQDERTDILAYLLPPLTIWFLYVLSLGKYANFHTGYTILTQIMAFWSIAATVYILLNLLRGRLQTLAAVASLSMTIILLIVGLHANGQKLSTTSYKAELARQWVSISTYLNELLTPLPPGAHAWGSLVYALENPHRIQLISFLEADAIASKVPESSREAIAPDYIIWGYPENRDSTLVVLHRKGDSFQKSVELLPKYRSELFQNLTGLFPDYQYKLVSIVAGSPYNATRVYQRKSSTEQPSDALPLVSIYQPELHQWYKRLGSRLEVTFTPTPPVKFQVGYLNGAVERAADETASATLPVGDYLLRVKLKTNPQYVNSRILAVTSSSQVKQTISELGPDFDRTPYSPDDQEAFLVHHHSGGQIYISQFDSSPEATILGVEVHPIEGLPDYRIERQEKTFKALPAPTQWTPDKASGVKVTALESGSLVEGNNSQLGYQITSPSIPIQPHTQILVRLHSKIEQGKVCIGVLNHNAQEWIISPTILNEEYKFDSKNNQAMFVVLANCNPTNTGNARSRFILYDGAYSIWSEKFYVDELMNNQTKR